MSELEICENRGCFLSGDLVISLSFQTKVYMRYFEIMCRLVSCESGILQLKLLETAYYSDCPKILKLKVPEAFTLTQNCSGAVVMPVSSFFNVNWKCSTKCNFIERSNLFLYWNTLKNFKILSHRMRNGDCMQDPKFICFSMESNNLCVPNMCTCIIMNYNE